MAGTGGGHAADWRNFKREQNEFTQHVAATRDVREATPYGQTLYDVLDMPKQYGKGDQRFVMGADPQGTVTYFGQKMRGPEVMEWTVAGGVEWLRDQAVNNKEGYNSLVAQLYQAGYLSESDVRFNSYTSKVAEAFAEAAYDTVSVNAGRDAGSVISLMDNLDNIIKGFDESGMGPNAKGGRGGAAQPPVRVDQYTDEATLRENVRSAAQAALGRSLSDEEEAAFFGAFRSKEKGWNDERHTAELNEFNGTAASVHDRPSAAAESAGYVREGFAQEKAGEDLASYVGVMNRMMGLGGEGIGLATG